MKHAALLLAVLSLLFTPISRAQTNAALPAALPSESLKSHDKAEKEAGSSTVVELSGMIVAAVSVVLAALTLVVGWITAAGGFLVWKAWQEKGMLKEQLGDISKARDTAIATIEAQKTASIDFITRTAVGATRVKAAKQKLLELLMDAELDPAALYAELQKTVQYPDRECLIIYSKLLERQGANVDLVRLIRNGIQEYALHSRI